MKKFNLFILLSPFLYEKFGLSATISYNSWISEELPAILSIYSVARLKHMSKPKGQGSCSNVSCSSGDRGAGGKR
jgi:hypothetical protein